MSAKVCSVYQTSRLTLLSPLSLESGQGRLCPWNLSHSAPLAPLVVSVYPGLSYYHIHVDCLERRLHCALGMEQQHLCNA